MGSLRYEHIPGSLLEKRLSKKLCENTETPNTHPSRRLNGWCRRRKIRALRSLGGFCSFLFAPLSLSPPFSLFLSHSHLTHSLSRVSPYRPLALLLPHSHSHPPYPAPLHSLSFSTAENRLNGLYRGRSGRCAGGGWGGGERVAGESCRVNTFQCCKGTRVINARHKLGQRQGHAARYAQTLGCADCARMDIHIE